MSSSIASLHQLVQAHHLPDPAASHCLASSAQLQHGEDLSIRFALRQGEGLWPGEEVMPGQMSSPYNGSLGKGRTLPELSCARDQQLEVDEASSNHHPGASCCSCYLRREVHKEQQS